MTPEEIAASTDVDQLYVQLKAARAFDDADRARLLQRRLREITDERSAPHPHRTPDEGRPVIASHNDTL